ncbi:MAG: TetR/AcrR family transcriptional regulator [Pirellulales bacterium]
MKSNEKNTRSRLIEAAVRRFRRDGFRNVGIDQVYTEVGISKTAFYKHFESKDDLMLAVLAEQTRQLLESGRAMLRLRGGTSAVGQLRALFDLVEQIIETDEFHGCIFVSVTMEFPLPHDPVHVAAVNAKQSFEGMVCEIAERAGATDPHAVARELCLVFEGAYVTRHLTGDSGTIDVVRRLGDLVLARHFPETAHA